MIIRMTKKEYLLRVLVPARKAWSAQREFLRRTGKTITILFTKTGDIRRG